MWTAASLLVAALAAQPAPAAPGNRLVYLDDFCNPYYAGVSTPRLVTPQWVGDQGVEAVIVLAVDDMADTQRYETFLRPILERLKQIDGRAAVSIMTKQVDPADPQLQQWFAEGVNIETHTVDHPCPCLQPSKSAQDGLAAAKDTFDRCVDLLSQVPGGRPVAYRMPCCDSMNSVSPRFFAEVFNKTTPESRFLTIDTSVFQVYTADDPALERELVLDEAGRERFRKYVPADRRMVNLVENYPYPFVIGRLVWEFPCLMPSDWDAQNLNGKCSPATVRDLKRAVDATVAKQGVFSLCFHPHGWIAAEQVVELIDYAERTYGGRIKFLNFAEVQDRLDTNLLAGQPLRAADGADNGVRVVDLDNDGFMDVVAANSEVRLTRVWQPESQTWQTAEFPVPIVEQDANGRRFDTGVRFGLLRPGGRASIVVRNDRAAGVWHFDGSRWEADPNGLAGVEADGPLRTAAAGRDLGVRLRDLDGDGLTELVVGNPDQNAAFKWSTEKQAWRRLPYALPAGTAVVDVQGRDAGLRFVDVDEDGREDVVFSNADRCSLHLFTPPDQGWSRTVLAGPRSEEGRIPAFVRADGTNNGAWFNYGHLWVQNEDTGKVLPGEVDGRSFAELLAGKANRSEAAR